MKQKIILAHLALFGANLIYAINYGYAKDVMGEGYVPPFAFIFFRVIGATALFWITSMIYSEKIKKALTDGLVKFEVRRNKKQVSVYPQAE